MPASGDSQVRIGREAAPIATLRVASSYPNRRSSPRSPPPDTGRIGSLQVSSRDVTN